LHLCGHDFTGYGVTWRRGVVFSNAAVQLTSSHPRVLPLHPFPRRRKAYSSTFTSSGVGSSEGGGGSGGGGAECKFTAGGNLFAGASAPSKVTEHGDTLGVAGGITTLPPRIPRFTDFGVRPRRWRRRLSGLLNRFSFLLTTHSLTDGAQQTSTVLDPHYSIGCGSNRIQPTPSSLAALRSGDGDFVVDPTLSVFGSGGSRGGSRSGYVGRRNPLVFDVYVVIEEGVNDREILPDYSKSKTSHENATPGRQSSQSLQGNNACCMHRNHSPLHAPTLSHPVLMSQPVPLPMVLIRHKIDFECAYLFTHSFTSLHLLVPSFIHNHSVIHSHEPSSLK
uniref:TLDc domain-containing protein n=1 Tax=Taenia asiatica TaxID=60517 RepID=A0A0R3VXP4_TAEAS